MSHIKYFFFGLYLLTRSMLLILAGLTICFASLLGLFKLLSMALDSSMGQAINLAMLWLAIFICVFSIVMSSYAVGKERLDIKP